MEYKAITAVVSECERVARMSGGLQQQRQQVEQLRKEAGIKRISVSQAVEDLKVWQPGTLVPLAGW